MVYPDQITFTYNTAINMIEGFDQIIRSGLIVSAKNVAVGATITVPHSVYMVVAENPNEPGNLTYGEQTVYAVADNGFENNQMKEIYLPIIGNIGANAFKIVLI